MKKKNKECLKLANDIIDDFELSKSNTKSILFKCLRLCRLSGDTKGEKLFTYELSGYPQSSKGIKSDVFDICRLAGRTYMSTNFEGGKEVECASTTLLASLYAENEALKLNLESARDPNISISSSNPNQYMFMPSGNKEERKQIVSTITRNEALISKVEGKLYSYVMNIRNVLMYSNVVVDGIEDYKITVDNRLKDICPEAIKMFISSYDNLNSSNSEDWANAVHSCRRILKEIADHLFPVPNPDYTVINGTKVKLADENYINRLIQYISKTFSDPTTKTIVKTTLENIGNQIDAIYNSTNKGTHANVKKKEAERFVIYSYMLIGDILSLKNNP